MYMRTRLLSLFALLFLAHNAIAQLTSLGLAEEIHCTVNRFVPFPLLEVSDNYLYASTSKGLYRYALDGTGEWSLVLATDKFVSDCAVRGDTVIVESISRFARNTRDLLELVEQLTKKGVEFVSKNPLTLALHFIFQSIT